MAPKFGFLVLLVSQMASPPNKWVTQMESPPFKRIMNGDAILVTHLFGGATVRVTNLFNGNAKCVKDSFGGDAIWETSSRRKPDFVPFLEYKMDSNENFSCHSVISRFKCTKYKFLSNQCRVPLRAVIIAANPTN